MADLPPALYGAKHERERALAAVKEAEGMLDVLETETNVAANESAAAELEVKRCAQRVFHAVASERALGVLAIYRQLRAAYDDSLGLE